MIGVHQSKSDSQRSNLSFFSFKSTTWPRLSGMEIALSKQYSRSTRMSTSPFF